MGRKGLSLQINKERTKAPTRPPRGEEKVSEKGKSLTPDPSPKGEGSRMKREKGKSEK
jgi:hypothetical protein